MTREPPPQAAASSIASMLAEHIPSDLDGEVPATPANEPETDHPEHEQSKRRSSAVEPELSDPPSAVGALAYARLCPSPSFHVPLLEPLSRPRLIWQTIVSLASIVTLAIQPLCWAFPDYWPQLLHAVGTTCTPIFFMHMLVVFRTAVPQHGVLNHDACVIGVAYVCSFTFFSDLLAALAYPLASSISIHLTPICLFALPHVLTATHTYERATKASHSTRRIIVLCMLTFTLLHWNACIWSLLADSDKSIRASLRSIPPNATDDVMPMSWFDLYQSTLHVPQEPSNGIIYLYAVYWTLATTTTIGYGDVLPANELEVGVLCGTIAASALLYSSLIAYMSNLILSSDVNWTAHKQRVETIRSYMRHRKIPLNLQTRIEEYLDYLWTTQKGLDENDITSMLPATLRQQLSLFCNSRIISRVPLFKGLPSHVCAAIVNQLQPRIFVPQDLIIAQGDLADEMFLIYRGVVKLVEISEKLGHSVCLNDGDYFGEIAVLTGGRRMMSVVASTYCHLYSLQQRLLEKILQQHPECINNLLVNMMQSYDNFEEIKEQIISLAGGDVGGRGSPPALTDARGRAETSERVE